MLGFQNVAFESTCLFDAQTLVSVCLVNLTIKLCGTGTYLGVEGPHNEEGQDVEHQHVLEGEEAVKTTAKEKNVNQFDIIVKYKAFTVHSEIRTTYILKNNNYFVALPVYLVIS